MSCSSGSATPVPTAGAAAAAAQDDDEEEEAEEGSGGGVRFHPRCGHMVSLSGCRRVAVRAHAAQEFNHGVVMSARPLQDNQMFEVRLDKKVHSWSGSIEVGVTTCDPDTLESPLPSSATEFRRDSWIMSGSSVLRDGRSVSENYGSDLDKLEEGDRVGVLKTSNGDLIFFVNGVSQSVAATGLPSRVFAVVDLYGKCAGVTLMDNSGQEARILSNALTNEATAAAASQNHVNMISSNSAMHNITNSSIAAASSAAAAAAAANDASNAAIAAASSSAGAAAAPVPTSFNNNKIRFHERKGTLVKLSNNNRTAERRRPYDEFNNGVVMTHRPLKDNELFEIRIDRLVDKWSGSIEVGITTHNPTTLDFPTTMTNAKSGTMMMSGCGILTNGRGTRREYGEFNLDELNEGDRIGMVRKASGNLHFYINGLDQGVAATKVPQQMWGVVDLYGMTVKVTIVDRDERDEQNLITRRNVAMREQQQQQFSLPSGADGGVGLPSTSGDPLSNSSSLLPPPLLFHPNCGSHAAVINGGLTAHRPNASDDFNFGVVLTARPLRTNEVFEVRLDKMVSKWAGSIEIGVTTHSPPDLDFPSTMTNVRSGTWMMTGNGVMHNGTTVFDEYGRNLDKLRVGDRVAVVRKEGGTVHFFVNSEDQGPAATNVPDCVYGVIDLYGQAAQATIIDLASDLCHPHQPMLLPMVQQQQLQQQLQQQQRSPAGDSEATSATVFSQMEAAAAAAAASDLRFHHLHGRNARISNSGITASRPNALGEFNDAIVITNRPLRDGEPFEIVIERMVERWSGSIEAGVTLIRPEDLEFPNTMTDIDYDTWMLSGSAVMRDGQTVRNGYCCDLDTLSVGSRLGMVRHADGTLHYTINGEDQGIACESIPPSVYAVVDLYGQCAQVSIVHSAPLQALMQENSLASSQVMESSHVSFGGGGGYGPSAAALAAEVAHHRFASVRGALELRRGGQTCVRSPSSSSSSSGGGAVAVGSPSLEGGDDAFEIRVDSVDPRWAGSIRFGATSRPPLEVTGDVFYDRKKKSSDGGATTVWLEDTCVRRNGKAVKVNYSSSLERLAPGDRLSVRRTSDGYLRFSVNGEDLGAAAARVPKRLTPVVELSGAVVSVSVTSSGSPHSVFQQQQHSASAVASPGEASHNSLTGSRHHGHGQLPDSLGVVLEQSEDNSGAEGGAAAAACASAVEPLRFHDNHGRNVILSEAGARARRGESYNQGVVLSNRPLLRGERMTVRLCGSNPNWSASIAAGLTAALSSSSSSKANTSAAASSSTGISLPVTALGLKKGSFVLSGDSLFVDGARRPRAAYRGFSLDRLRVGQTVGVGLDQQGRMRVFVNGVDQGVVASELSRSSASYHAVFDLYGQCEEVAVAAEGQESPQQEEAGALGAELTGAAATAAAAAAPAPAPPEANSNKKSNLQDLSPSSPANDVRPGCEYLSLCSRFRSSLALPASHFSPAKEDRPTCFCRSCHRLRGEAAYAKKGDPPREYALPIGWCRFPLSPRLRQQHGGHHHHSRHDTDGWHTAYHPASAATVRSALDTGDLLSPDSSSSSGCLERRSSPRSRAKASKEDDSDNPPLLFSPTLKYLASASSGDSSSPLLCPVAGFGDRASGRRRGLRARLALQVEINPGSYKVGPPSASTSSSLSPPDPHFKLDETEWLTKERGNTVVSALLVCVQEEAIPPPPAPQARHQQRR